MTTYYVVVAVQFGQIEPVVVCSTPEQAKIERDRFFYSRDFDQTDDQVTIQAVTLPPNPIAVGEETD